MEKGAFRAKLRVWCRRGAIGIAILTVVVVVAGLIWFRHAIYHRFIGFPREEAAWKALRAEIQPVPKQPGWTEYRGVLHSHSFNSHDCEVPFEGILAALREAKVDFICLSDHCTNGRADFDLQWRGVHSGKLFIPGFEMKEGVMPFGVRPGVVLSNSTPTEVLGQQIVENGGLVFFAHPEEPRMWELPQLTGMEIYNTHTDFKRYEQGLVGLLPELLLNHRRYPEHVVRLIFQRPEQFLRRWDELNLTRHVIGIAGNDCHQNTGLRGIYTDQGTLRVEDTSPKTLNEWKLNWLSRGIVRLCLGELKPGKVMFHFQLDPYERMARYVNTHVLAENLSERAVLEGLSAGRAFVGFDLIADSSGFIWRATSGEETALFGESLSLKPGTRLEALSPLPCRFSVVANGERVYHAVGRSMELQPAKPGKYRVEAELDVRGQWVPWVYANHIELK